MPSAAEEGARKAALALGEVIPTPFDESLPAVVFAVVTGCLAVFGVALRFTMAGTPASSPCSSFSLFINDPILFGRVYVTCLGVCLTLVLLGTALFALFWNASIVAVSFK